ncbi:MAG TPA: CocE/NonD family hydrolase [Dehalococcoidia bacterium]|nr:CocE/NonD family hydrolase [Dehalococcoidia bacterium]
MTSSVRIDHDVPMRTRDGVTLRADVFRPDDNARHPAILSRTPYDKRLSWNSDFLGAVQAARAGYAFVIQDTRGRFASEGEFRPGMPEGKDGYDAVEWVAAEPWCDGSVGMAGGSYLGRIQWQTALEQPPSLKAIAPAIITSGPLSEFRQAGVVDFEANVSWFSLMAVEMANRLERQGRDVAEIRRRLERARQNIDEVLNYLPFRDVPHFNFEGIREGFQARASDALPPEITKPEDLFWDFSRITVPCFHAGGWFDIYSGSIFTSFSMMQKHGGSEAARRGQHVFCGPWVHGGQLPAFAGGLHFGPTANAAGSFSQARQLAFFDKYLRGKDVEIPAVRYFVMGANRWRNGTRWPLPETEWRCLYLSSNGRAQSAAGDGVLSFDAPGDQSPDRFLYDPMFPVPTVGGRSLPTGKLVPGPLDQTHVERRGDVLCYTTSELRDDLEVTGPLTLHLFAATSAVDTDFVAKLVDVYPDGAAYNVAEGVIRARFRKGLLSPKPVVPGEVSEYVIDMANVSIVFRKGHRVRLDVTSSNFPRIDRNMNTGHALGEDAEGIPAVQTVFHDAKFPSHLYLPVIPSRGGNG